MSEEQKDIQGEMMDEFLSEALDLGAAIADMVERLRDNPEDEEVFSELLMHIEIMNASAAISELAEIVRLGGGIEKLLRGMMHNKSLDRFESLDMLSMSVEVLLDVINNYAKGETKPVDIEEIVSSIDVLLEGAPAAEQDMGLGISLDDEEQAESEEEDSSVSKELQIKFFADAVSQHLLTIDETLDQININPDREAISWLIRSLQGIKGASAFIKNPEILMRADALENEFVELLNTTGEIEKSNPLFLDISDFSQGIRNFIEDIRDVTLEETVEDRHESKAEGGIPTIKASSDSSKSEESLKVSIRKVDRLMNCIEELMTLNTKMLTFRNQVASDEKLAAFGKEMTSISQFFEKLTEQLYKQMLNVRMMPVKSLFNKFKNVIETISVEQKKKIKVAITGENTEVDRVVLESLKDPLIHLIRNAVDHGVEKPEDRLATGKNEMGHVSLSAFNDVNSVVIEIEDDGKGIDYIKIRDKAIEKGLISADEAAMMSRQEILKIIFAPGFSTAEKVTDLSGRGVGMDVVKTGVEKHGGSITIHTEKGKGTCFVIRLPLSMSMVDTLVVRGGNELFAIPTDGIEKILKVSDFDLKTIYSKAVFPTNGDTIPFRKISEVFGVDSFEESSGQQFMVIINSAGRKIALGLDEIIGKQKVVIKNLGNYLKNVQGISGACIQGDGSIILVVDLADIFSSAVAA
ncbi:MAG: chemotaxis protein CheA [Firmicutes bacterium]|nr:chemotaxis protein CheA [Bacillota bacterium]